jgi:5-hydroxyisourate hydrolase
VSTLSTHVLDAVRGTPAAGVAVRLERGGAVLAQAATDADGRIGRVGDADLAPGTYELAFATGEYFAGHGTETFYPQVRVAFTVADPDRHYHVPLLLSPFAYSTYRGS